MNCKKCDFKLVDGQEFCPRCGSSQANEENENSGVSMDLPPMKTSAAKAVKAPKAKVDDDKSTKKEATTDKSNKKDIKDTVKEAKKNMKETAQKVAKASSKAAKNAGEAVQDVAEKAKSGGNKTWMYVVIGVASVAVLCLIIYGLLSFNTADSEDETNSVLLAATEDEVLIIDGDELIPLIEDIPEEVDARDVITAIDGKSFYIINDVEIDEDSGRYTGDLILLKSNGKQEDIESDVIVGSQVMIGGVLWYEKADKEDIIVCSFDGKNVLEVIEEDNLDSWMGTDKADEAYYALMDDEDFTTEVFFISDGDDESIMDEAFIVTLSRDFKKVLLAVTEDGESTAYIYDGKDDFEVMEDVQDVLLDVETFDMFVIADEDDMVLYYVKYNKEAIELDDDVQKIVTMPNLSSPYFASEIDDMAYYIKDDDLYVADLKGNDTERLVKNAEELQILFQENDSKEIVYVDDDEIVKINFSNLKETTIDLPDADKLMSYDVAVAGNWYVYRTEDNKEIFAYKGGKDAIELSDDAEDISSFSAIFDGKYILWETYDGELILSQLKEDSAEEIGDDVFNYWVTEDEEIYFLSDYEDGEGDLFYISKVTKDAEKIEKNIVTIFYSYYE